MALLGSSERWSAALLQGLQTLKESCSYSVNKAAVVEALLEADRGLDARRQSRAEQRALMAKAGERKRKMEDTVNSKRI